MKTIKAEVVSATNLDPQSRSEIKKSLLRLFGRRVEIEYSVDESLIAGFVVRSGTKTINLTVKNILEKT